MVLFPDMEPDQAIVAGAQRSNVHLPWGTDRPMDRLAAIAASKDIRRSTSEPSPPAAFPAGYAAGGRISHR